MHLTELLTCLVLHPNWTDSKGLYIFLASRWLLWLCIAFSFHMGQKIWPFTKCWQYSVYIIHMISPFTVVKLIESKKLLCFWYEKYFVLILGNNHANDVRRQIGIRYIVVSLVGLQMSFFEKCVWKVKTGKKMCTENFRKMFYWK